MIRQQIVVPATVAMSKGVTGYIHYINIVMYETSESACPHHQALLSPPLPLDTVLRRTLKKHIKLVYRAWHHSFR